MAYIVVFTLICCLCAVSAAPKETCDGILVNGKIHRKHVLAEGINRPYHLSYDKVNHSIYFTYNVGNDTEDTFGIAYLPKNSTQPEPIKHIENGFATAIDSKDRIIYFGGSDGIYKHHIDKNETLKIVDKHNIWDMFYHHSLYFIAYPSQRLYRHESDKSKAVLQTHIHEKIYQYVIDGNNNTFITNGSGLYKIEKDSSHRVHYEGPHIFRVAEVNNKGVAHFCGQDDIYVVKEKTLHKIAEIKNIFGLAFDDDDNIIYADPTEIVKLLPGCK